MAKRPSHVTTDSAAGMLTDTTEVRRQETLLKTGALQTAILNSANFSSIATDEKGVIQIFNIGAESMLGYSAAEMVDKVTPAEISDPLELIARAKELSVELNTPIAPGFEALVFKASRGIEDIYELTYIRKDGSRFPAVVSVTSLRDEHEKIIGYLLIGTDNTARKQAEEQLQWAEESFRLMVESVTDSAIVMLDPDGNVVSWNSGAERIKGYTADEILGEHFSRFYTPEDIADGEPQRELDTVTDEGHLEIEGWRVRKDGSTFYANVAFTAIRDGEGNLRGFAKLTGDLTASRMFEAELQDAKRVAETANHAKSEFLSSMSHELRSPLNAILGFAQLMASDTPPPTADQKASIDQILLAGWHLLKLIDEVLDLAKIESGHVPLSPEPVSLAEIMLECHGMMEEQAEKRDITLLFPEFETPCFVRADRTRVIQVLTNLLSNAIKYNVRKGTVEVSCAQSPTGHTRVSVRDTGPGLSPKQLEQLFQAFNRLGQEAGGVEGTGIGLVVSKQLVELMGGEIGAESTVGKGSMFWFELDAVAGPRSSAGMSRAPASPGATALHGTPHIVLHIEDNPTNLKLVEQIISRHPDLVLQTATSGGLGIGAARAFRPDLILMDINLPDMDGFEALRILRSDPETEGIPVIAVSANAMPRDIKKGLQAGFFRYITKPIMVDEFMDALYLALESADAESDAEQ